jgi:peptidoglycan-associated lipoprotein
MKRSTILHMLLLTVMLSALGCANNDVVKKDEGLVPATPQKSADTNKVTASPTLAATSAPTPTINPATSQIVPADPQKLTTQHIAPSGVVYFGFDSYELTTESGNILQANFNKLASRPSIQIEGHCDEQGSSEYNLSLGEKRAKAAQNYMVTLGYPAAKISTISYGKERPAAPGHDEVAWAQNRRDELKIVQ